MRLTKELFEKLNKNDQDEYKERRKKILDDFCPFSLFVTYILWTIYIFAFSLIVLPLWKIAFGSEVFIRLGAMFYSLFKIMFFIIGLGLIIDIILILFMLAKLIKLKEEYFKIEVKVKRRR